MENPREKYLEEIERRGTSTEGRTTIIHKPRSRTWCIFSNIEEHIKKLTYLRPPYKVNSDGAWFSFLEIEINFNPVEIMEYLSKE